MELAIADMTSRRRPAGSIGEHSVFISLVDQPAILAPKKKVFLFNYLNFPPRAVRLSATLAPASCSAEHPSVPPQQLQLGRGLELLSEGADSASPPVSTALKLPPGPNAKEANKPSCLVVLCKKL